MRPRSRRLVAVIAALAAVMIVTEGEAQAALTQDEALRLAFPAPAAVERRTAFLSEAQLDAARARAGGDAAVDRSVITYYVASRDGRPVGVAYFDSHRVRTLNEVLMIVVAPSGTIDRIEVLRFSEPPEYRASDGWLAQLEGKPLSDELSLKGSVVNMTGATLTSQAAVRAARRVLALHEQIRPFQQQVGVR